MKLNHFICPLCGHDFYADAAYATCDACQCCFYATHSQTCDQSRMHERPSIGMNGLDDNGNMWIMPRLGERR
jgi:hypothetical protein